ncbi:cytochrome C oxidase subunit IV family protein [Pseudomonas nitroreducens]|uniref:cytochrome C oxidase subunit IV family protein n=1 Tax=Pseudomonas nitroreducens TaxID=46680 RepID=UPI00351D43D3
MKTLLVAWLLMLPMSVAGVWLGHHAPDALLPVALILLLGLGKAWLIALRFMELGHGPRLWRSLLLGWPLVVTGVILALHATH